MLVQADDSAAGFAARAQSSRPRSATALERDGRSDAVVAQSGAQADALWALRENIAEAQRREGPNIKHDISLPVSAIPRFLDECGARARDGVARTCASSTFGHLGDGNLHYNLAAPPGVAPEAFLASTPVANRIVHDLVARASAAASAPSTASAS